MKIFKYQLYILLMAAMLAACAQMPQAGTFNERLAVGYSLVTVVRDTATTLLNANKITAEDGANVLASTDAARAALDVARNLSKTDMSAAEGKLAATHAALVALQQYLASRGQ